MYPKDIWLLFATLLVGQVSATTSSDDFKELLTLRPLRDGRVATHFSFEISSQTQGSDAAWNHLRSDKAYHHALFPLALGQLLREYDVTEMHLTLNAGKWDYGQWGMPEDPAVASGAELWAWMGSNKVDAKWKGLRNALSGLFCASIGQLDELRTTSPTQAFRPEGELPVVSQNASYALRHASLPAQHVCTENLTPFLKLLPCKSTAGIATLLNPHRIFDADWHGMGVHVLKDNLGNTRLKLSVQAVFDPTRISKQDKRDFSLHSLFGKTISKACPVTSQSYVEVGLPSGVGYTIVPEPQTTRERVAVYDTSTARHQALDISVNYPDETVFSYPLTPSETPLTGVDVVRTLAGSSQSLGRLTVRIQSTASSELQVLYVETMPWLLSFYLHTMAVTIDGKDRRELLSDLSYTPAEPHGHPTLLEAKLTIPAGKTLLISMDVAKAFLRYTEHPPDAQRGWDLPPAIFFLHSTNSSRGSPHQRLYSPALLVDVATPDFSMPYNVIIMTGTVMTFTFVTIFNLLTRKLVYVSPATGASALNQERKQSTLPNDESDARAIPGQ